MGYLTRRMGYVSDVESSYETPALRNTSSELASYAGDCIYA